MNQDLVRNNCLPLPNFLLPQQALSFHQSFFDFVENNALSGDEQVQRSSSSYNYPLFFRLLLDSVIRVSDILGEYVLPTYSYARLYHNGADLKKHSDRDACEISLTIHLYGDKVWPIYFQRPDGSEVCLLQQPGDAALYLGCESKHWREAYEGQFYSQVFLHYVRANGPKAYTYFDRKTEKDIVIMNG